MKSGTFCAGASCAYPWEGLHHASEDRPGRYPRQPGQGGNAAAATSSFFGSGSGLPLFQAFCFTRAVLASYRMLIAFDGCSGRIDGECDVRIILIFVALIFAPFASAQGTTEDAELQNNLNQIYASTTDLSSVAARVENGVVTLSGEISNSELAKDAVEIAESAQGTIYVQDQIDRLLVVDSDVFSALDGLKKDAEDILQALPIIGLALLILTLFIWFGGIVSRRDRFWARIATNPFLGDLMAQTMRILFVLAGLIIALNLLGAQAMIATILGGAGLVGIAIGFAVRDTLENYLASILLSLRQPFRAGDHVLIGSHSGKVMRLTSRATILMTMGGNHLRIPNSTVFKAIILNYTTNPERRFDFELGVDAGDDPVAAMKTGLDVMRASDYVLDEPAPSASISNVGDSNIVIKFYGWVDQRSTSFGKSRSLSIRGVKNALESKGFSLPEPIYRLKIDGAEGLSRKVVVNATGSKLNNPPQQKSIHVATVEVDVTPDDTIDQKVEESLSAGEDNLLDNSKPVE